mgnify:CR=1 FL=1
MKTKLYLSIIIPCYNESENLKRGVLDEVYDFLKKQDFEWEVIISDDGSSDDSRELVRGIIKDRKNFILLENKHGGKPYAIWCGLQKAKGEFVLFTDMDQSTPIGEFLKLKPFLKENDIVIGSRGLSRKNYSFLRKIGSAVFLLIRKSLLLPEINDTQCGFKVFRTAIVKAIFPKLEFFKQKEKVKGWKVTSYDVELLFIAEKLGYKIKEVTVDWFNEDISKGKKRSYFKESKEMLGQILRVKINDLKGYYSS